MCTLYDGPFFVEKEDPKGFAAVVANLRSWVDKRIFRLKLRWWWITRKRMSNSEYCRLMNELVEAGG